jgi:hypothetical protein
VSRSVNPERCPYRRPDNQATTASRSPTGKSLAALAVVGSADVADPHTVTGQHVLDHPDAEGGHPAPVRHHQHPHSPRAPRAQRPAKTRPVVITPEATSVNVRTSRSPAVAVTRRT